MAILPNNCTLFKYVLFFPGKYKAIIRNCTDDMDMDESQKQTRQIGLPYCSEEIDPIVPLVLKIEVIRSFKKSTDYFGITHLIGKWCACFHSGCNKMTVSVLEASISVPSTAESNINNVITEIGFPVTTHSSINNVVHVSEFKASLPVLPTTQAPINNAVTVGELEAAPDFVTATHSMDKNVTIGVISVSPNILIKANLFAFIISSFYFTV